MLFRTAEQTQWSRILEEQRSAYESLRSHHLRAIENPDEVDSDIDPLSEHEESPWTALRGDETVRQEIYQDVERCMPENVYFRQPATQKMLLDILFIYCKLNPDVGYRQGMHELLAPILWVVERDAMDPDDVTTEYSPFLESLLGSQYIEHDTFTLFALVMQRAKSFYDPAFNGISTSSKARSNRKDSQQESPILQRCRHIFDELLPKVDPELADHLHRLEIMPQIFLMRWLRLLFGREFPFDELLQVWDLLFAEDPSLELVDYICVAMLLRIRWQLVSADGNEALTLLLRYLSPPAPHPPATFVEDAALLKSRTSIETGHQLISQHTGRTPRRVSTTVERPSTPKNIREQSASRSPRFPSPFGSPASGTLESVFQDVARGMLTRGGQAVRDAMGEVRRNVHTLQTGRSSPLARSLPGTSAVGHRTKKSDAPSTIAANVLRRINALEERNKQLAKMLEAAVSDLWEYQKSSTEREKATPEDSLESLNVAIAKVQFVQVYLSDTSLMLPPENTQALGRQRSESQDSTPPASDAENYQESKQKEEAPPDADKLGPTSRSNAGTLELDNSKDPFVTVSPPSSAVSALSQEILAAPKPSLSPSHRPSLAQSSFSYMLSQAHEDPSSSFLNASPLTPNERRNRVGADKAFLFGDDEGAESDQSSSRGRPRGRPKAKGKGVMAQGEDIGLGDLTSTPEGD